MRALLTIEAGQGEPRICHLDPAQRVTLGRHRDNIIVLHDQHASRWHAEVFQEDGRWFIRDFGATNRTRVNGETITQQAPLEHGQLINVGTTALRFTLDAFADAQPTPPVVEVAVPPEGPPSSWQVNQTVLCKDELSILCQFMAESVRERDPRALVQRALELIYSQTGASVAGYLSLDHDDPLPKMVIPKLSRVDIHLSRRLTQEVQLRGRAVWLGSQPDTMPEMESLQCFTDALCVPLQAGETPLGAIHVYKSGKLFGQREVRFCELLVGHLANSLHLQRIQRMLEAENSRLRNRAPAVDELVGSSPALQQLRQRIARLAPASSTVLIVGESGAGKELVALALHRQSPRREGPLVSVNCAAFAPSLLESTLFGHCKGAFSGADNDHPGLFRQADEGTLFLDEVGELSLDCQAKLLRVVEGMGFRPVGATAEVQVNVRTIAATHRDLEQEVQAGRFRQDLYFRLQGIQIRVPPLREHLEDMEELLSYFLGKLTKEWGRQVKLTDAAVQRLREYSWPGNVRQLCSVLENAVALSDKETLEPADLLLPAGTLSAEPPSLNLEELEQWAIRRALRLTGGNISQAARELGVVRDTLTSRMKKFGICKDEP